MKIIALIARYLLGLAFLVFGLNGFFHFIPQPPMTGLALQFIVPMASTGYMPVVFALQLVSGIILLSGRLVPFALVLLGPVLVNILLFHIFFAPAGLPLPVILAVFFLIVLYSYRASFAGIFEPKARIEA